MYKNPLECLLITAYCNSLSKDMLNNLFLNEDITVEILTRLPAKEIARLRCVCKRWLCLSSDPRFIMYHSARNPHPATSGFLLRHTGYFPLNATPSGLPDPSLSFIPASATDHRARISIESSCNGLIICFRAIIPDIKKSVYYVCNPTTRAFITLPMPNNVDRCFSLACDPSKSPHYKVVSIGLQIHIYSSETRSWNLSACKESPREYGGCQILRTVFWNGALIWDGEACLVSFDVDGEYMKKLPVPQERVVYIGESRGKLQMIGKAKNEQITTVFDILEMDSQCSGWTVLHHVDLGNIKDLYPEIQQRRRICTSGAGLNYRSIMRDSQPRVVFQAFSPVYFIRGKEEEEGILLLCIPRKLLSYDLQNKSFETICDGLYSLPVDWYQFYHLGYTLFSP